MDMNMYKILVHIYYIMNLRYNYNEDIFMRVVLNFSAGFRGSFPHMTFN